MSTHQTLRVPVTDTNHRPRGVMTIQADFDHIGPYRVVHDGRTYWFTGKSGTHCASGVATREMLVEAGAKHSKIKTHVGRGTQTLLMPGTTLIREWEEREYRVTVTPEGLYALDGHLFKSLSAAARHITGTRWNGPKFFGLRDGKGSEQ